MNQDNLDFFYYICIFKCILNIIIKNMFKIILKKGMYYIVQKWWNSIYTYAVCDNFEKATELLEIIEQTYG